MVAYFVRHGESEATMLGSMAPAGHDLPLTEHGRGEAEDVAKYFADHDIQVGAVYTSSMVRAVQTAEPTAAHFGLPVITDDRLRERDWGSMNVCTWTEVAERLKPMLLADRYHFTPDGGESWAQMEARVLAALTDIKKVPVDTVAVFTHGGVLRGLLPVLAGVDKSEHERFTMKTGGIARYDTTDNSVTILR